MTPLFTIIHPTARPNAWRAVYDAWIANAVDPSRVQYILVCDERWGFQADTLGGWPTERGFGKNGAGNLAVWSAAPYKHSGMVSSVNLGATYAEGQILIVVADDQFPCEHWDERISGVIETHVARRLNLGHDPAKWEDGIFTGELWGECVVSVSTNTPNEHERGIMVMPILSRARYERLGYVFYPEYESMYADNEFAEHARQDGVVIDARHLVFPHKHWLNWERRKDAIDQAQNHDDLYRRGEGILKRRRACKFDNNAMVRGDKIVFDGDLEVKPEAVTPKTPVHLMIPGEQFPAIVVGNLLGMLARLASEGHPVGWVQQSTSCVYVTRNAMMIQVQDVPPGYLLWMDDDQVVSPDNVMRLIRWMEKTPEADVICGWTWIQPSVAARASCGRFDENGNISPISNFAINGEPELVEVEWTGFPCVLMRWDVIQKVGKNPFNPIPAPKTDVELYGEDVSFSLRLRKAGGRMFCAPDVYVPHLKLREAVPVIQVTPKCEAMHGA